MTPPPDPKQSPAKPAPPIRSNGFRGRHRSISDEAAHDNGKPFTPPPIIEHEQVCRDQPELVTTPAQLDRAVDHLRTTGTFGYDTEFIGEDSYHPHLCVIQAATAERVFLIDPLAIDNLSPWWSLLTDPTLTKIVHAGAQDIEPVFRTTGKAAANIFDTQVAGGLAGLDYPLSLGNTIQAILGVEHDAGAKFSKWDRRPLTPQQVHYAAGDVRYLIAIHTWLSDKIEGLGNTAFVAAACADLCEPQRHIPDPLARKIKAKGVNKLSRKKRAVFNGVLLWRETLAQQLNITPRGLLTDEGVYEVADTLPREAAQVGAIKFVPRPLAEQHGQSLVEAIEQAIDGPYPKKRKPPTYDRDEHRNAVNALWQRIATRCEERSISPAVVTSKRELGPLVGAAMQGWELPELGVNTGWRRDLLGSIITGDLLALSQQD